MHYIYKIENKINKKIYIGQTINFKKRINEHKSGRKNTDIHKNQIIDKSIKKYGKNNFLYTIIDQAKSQDEADYKEKMYISKYDCLVPKGYNILKGGRSQQGAWNMKEVNMYDLDGNFLESFECARILSEKYPEYKEANIKDCCRKNTYYKNKIFRYSNKDYSNLDIKICKKSPRAKKVYQYDLQGNLIGEYSSLITASKKTNTSRTSISSCLSGKYQMANGFIWFYEKPKEKPEINKRKLPGNKGFTIIQKKQGKVINTFVSTVEAVEHLGLEKNKYKQLCKCINKNKEFYGFEWEKVKTVPSLKKEEGVTTIP